MLPGVVSAGMVNRLPLGGVMQIGGTQFENVDAGEARLPGADWRTVTPSYLPARRAASVDPAVTLRGD